MDLCDVPIAALPAVVPPHARVAPNFLVSELTRSELAARNRIDNSLPTREITQAVVHLCRQVLQPVRDQFGAFIPNSVCRSQALERVLKNKPPTWESKSQHTLGEAADIEVPGLTTLALAQWVEANLALDQMICECYDPAQGANSGWVHVSLEPQEDNRQEVLSYVMMDDGYSYIPGLD